MLYRLTRNGVELAQADGSDEIATQTIINAMDGPVTIERIELGRWIFVQDYREPVPAAEGRE